MQFSATNDFTVNRESRWTELWQVEQSFNGSNYKDYALSDYLPSFLWDFGFEKLISYPDVSVMYRQHLHASTVAVVVYLAAVMGGQRAMRNSKPFGLKRTLACWNLLLAVFSAMGALRLIPHIVYGHWLNPAAYFVCRSAPSHTGSGSTYFWVSVFVWSKYFELVDTALLVLRKKPVSFLHWFHHATVLMYTWHSMAHVTNTGIYFAGMNYLVHSVMYFYYFLAAIGKPPNWGFTVTVMQITQMLVGIALNVFQYHSYTVYPHCDVAWRNIHAAVLMYAAYMGLFLQFFIKRYCTSSSRSAPATRNYQVDQQSHLLDKSKAE